MTKAKQIILGILVGIPVLLFINLVTPIALIINIVRKQCTKFTNVTLASGENITFGYMVKHFSQRLEPVILNTDQGKLLVIHGHKNGAMVLPTRSLYSNYEDVIDELGLEGEYYIASCYNGCRSDYSNSKATLKRVAFTETPWPSIIWPWRGRVYICSSRVVSTLLDGIEWLGKKLS